MEMIIDTKLLYWYNCFVFFKNFEENNEEKYFLIFLFALTFLLLPTVALAAEEESINLTETSSPTPGWSEDGKSFYHPDGIT